MDWIVGGGGKLQGYFNAPALNRGKRPRHFISLSWAAVGLRAHAAVITAQTGYLIE